MATNVCKYNSSDLSFEFLLAMNFELSSLPRIRLCILREAFPWNSSQKSRESATKMSRKKTINIKINLDNNWRRLMENAYSSNWYGTYNFSREIIFHQQLNKGRIKVVILFHFGTWLAEENKNDELFGVEERRKEK